MGGEENGLFVVDEDLCKLRGILRSCMKQNKDTVRSLVLLLVTGVRSDPKYSYSYDIVLPLSHKSGELCLYEPLTVSDVFGDNFFEILSVFQVETHFFFFLAHYPACASG